ncbi:hypothetical protein QQF64_022555 [Cirrhinus molitorella]|uniref:Uncharacterized protein n=1 Tax=Cirrhinus molitorella TaxID=172907 RepID=A0ABR3L601_9TELE
MCISEQEKSVFVIYYDFTPHKPQIPMQECAQTVLISHSSPPKISDLAVNLTLTALQSLPQTNAEIEVLLFDVVV